MRFLGGKWRKKNNGAHKFNRMCKLSCLALLGSKGKCEGAVLAGRRWLVEKRISRLRRFTKNVIGSVEMTGFSLVRKGADDKLQQRQRLRGWRTAYTPTHRNVRDAWGTRALVADVEEQATTTAKANAGVLPHSTSLRVRMTRGFELRRGFLG
jgi:hypothetical protein